MKTSIRGLRIGMKRILNAVQHGEVVTVYSRKQAIAKIIPIGKPELADKDQGFGMWSDYSEAADVNSFVRKLRKGRKHDF